MPIMHKLTDANGKSYEISDELLQQLMRASADDDIVAEGASIRVPTLLRDGQPQAARDSRFDPPSAAQLQAVEDARQAYIDQVSNAWRNNNAAPPAVADSTPRANFPTRSLQPQPPPRQPVNDEREAAYNEYLDYLRNAWHREKEA